MARASRVLARVLSGTADQNLRFEQVKGLLLSLGFDLRVRGSHHIFSCSDVEEIINLQPREGGLAKPYQVRQVRELIVKYRLSEKERA